MAITKLQRLQLKANIAQGGRCYYCDLPVWEDDPLTFARIHGIRPRLCPHLQCTAEHLIARKDSGQDACENIVAACHWCNSERHRGREGNAPEPIAYTTWVRTQVEQSKWHPVLASQIARAGSRHNYSEERPGREARPI